MPKTTSTFAIIAHINYHMYSHHVLPLLYPTLIPPHPKKLPLPPASLPKVENLTISEITPFGFRVSWRAHHPQQQEGAPSTVGFGHFHIVVSDSGWLLEPQEFTVPGNQSFLDIWGLITGIGYEVRLTGVSSTGLVSRPLTTVAVTGTTHRGVMAVENEGA